MTNSTPIIGTHGIRQLLWTLGAPFSSVEPVEANANQYVVFTKDPAGVVEIVNETIAQFYAAPVLDADLLSGEATVLLFPRAPRMEWNND